jgi:putative flippase GtrA
VIISVIRDLLNSSKFRYLIAGGWNTVFGYSLGVILFLLLTDSVHTAFIAFICNLISMAMSFITYKLFVFRTKGNWIKEYFKACLVYGNVAIISIVVIWILVDLVGLNIWISQALAILVTVVISYFGHEKFTFKARV